MENTTKKIEHPSVSVIIAAYNEENHIEHCLATLISQSLPPHEIIVIDDGSTDSTWEKLSTFAHTHSNVKIFRKNHFEQATARNYGFSKSIGKILVFPDADYYFDREFLKKLITPIVKGEVIATYTNDEFVANPENIWSQCWNINAYLPLGKRIAVDNPIRSNNFRAIRRREFAKAGGFSETGYSNDVTVLNKLGVKDSGLAVPGAVCYHYNPSSLSKVFTSAYRKGSKGGVRLAPISFLIYSLLNTVRKGILEAVRNRKPEYFLFKVIFDAGIFLGLCSLLLERKSPYRWGQNT